MNPSNSKKTEYCVFWIPAMAQDSVRVINEGPLTVRIPGDRINSFYHLHSHVEIKDDNKPVVKVEVVKYRKRNPEKTLWERIIRTNFKESFGYVSEQQFRVFSGEEYTVYSRADLHSVKEFLNALKETRNRLVKSRLLHKSVSCVVEFSLEDDFPCGLAKFKVSVVDNYPIYRLTRNMICRHIVKHFHRHHFHEEYTYTPRFLENDIDIHENDSESLLMLFDEVYADMAGKLDGLYSDYETIDKSLDRKDRKEKIGRRERKIKRRQFYKNCHNMAGQLVFIKALTDSKENTCCRKGALVLEKEKYGTYACALENISEGVEALRSKIRYHHDSMDLQKAAIISYISLAVGIISLVVALISIDWNELGKKLGLIYD